MASDETPKVDVPTPAASFADLKASIDKLSARMKPADVEGTTQQEEDPVDLIHKVKKNNAYLTSAVMALLSIILWLFLVVKEPVRAQIVDDIKALHKVPAVEARITDMERDISDIKSDIHEQRIVIRETNSDLKALIIKMDKKK